MKPVCGGSRSKWQIRRKERENSLSRGRGKLFLSCEYIGVVRNKSHLGVDRVKERR